ncbi:hypothetical protein N2152v2_002251, partial [Parachlorella kessleri]
ARAAGIRCGDGAGAGGRTHVPHLRAMGAASLEECRRRCPGLQVRPMRTDRYRQVAMQIQAVLQRFAAGGEVEKTSYDDFYLECDLSSTCCQELPDGSGAPTGLSYVYASSHSSDTSSPCGQPPSSTLLLGDSPARQQGRQSGGGGDAARPHNPMQEQQRYEPQQERWVGLHPELRRGVQVAAALRAAVAAELGGMTLSCGVARSKLVARLAGPLAKPDGLTVVPDGEAARFVQSVPLRKVPSLRGKFGEEVEQALGARLVGDLLRFASAELAARFGEQRGAFLATLAHAQDDTPVRARGPLKSITSERSFPPTADPGVLRAMCAELVQALLPRLLEDYGETGRLPAKLCLAYRVGYASPRSKSCAVPATLCSWLRGAGATAGGSNLGDTGPGAAARRQQPEQGGAGEAPNAARSSDGSWPPSLEACLIDSYLALLPIPAAAAATAACATGAFSSKVEEGISRVALGVAFADSAGGTGVSNKALAPPAWQPSIAGFLTAKDPSPSQSLEGGTAGHRPNPSAEDPIVAGAVEQQQAPGQLVLCTGGSSPQAPKPSTSGQQQRQEGPEHQPHQQQHQQEQQQRPRQGHQPAVHAAAAACAEDSVRRPSYRNAEALALQAMFGRGLQSTSSSLEEAAAGAPIGGRKNSGSTIAADVDVGSGLSKEERESYALALRLQMQEAKAAGSGRGSSSSSLGAVPAHQVTAKRGPAQKQQGRGTAAGGSGKRGRAALGGPMDAFLRRNKG